jgi:hypothetical protein
MTTKTIAQMIAELPPESENTFAMLQREMAEVQLLRAALEKRQAGNNHGVLCPVVDYLEGDCTCGYNDANEVLEVTK